MTLYIETINGEDYIKAEDVIKRIQQYKKEKQDLRKRIKDLEKEIEILKGDSNE